MKYKVYTSEEDSWTVIAEKWNEPKEGAMFTRFYDDKNNVVAAFNTNDVVAIFETV